MNRTFDTNSAQTIGKLEKAFGFKSHDFNSVISKKSIGIEIEVKFKSFFPEIHKKYFENYKLYKSLEYSEKSRIAREISDIEKPLQEKLNKTVECGIPHGMDKYWEFAINPAHDIALLCKQVDILNKADLLPKGKHSLHINIGDVRATPKMYWILMTLELLYCSKERIASGFSENFTYMSATWAKKGDGGILVKNYNDLQESSHGVELRTLQFGGGSLELYRILNTLCTLLYDGDDKIAQIKKVVLESGLPDENFGKPHSNPDVWKKYVENFDSL
ncbi:MAG: hypothetical protein E6Q36_05570, partial [Chryseobacterium sp.]